MREIKHESFVPLIFSISGGMSPIATTVFERMASLIAEKHNHPYSCSSILAKMQAEFLFIAICNNVHQIRGSRSSYHRPTNMFSEAIDLSCSECWFSQQGRTYKGGVADKGGGGGLNDLFTTINADCLIFCYE